MSRISRTTDRRRRSRASLSHVRWGRRDWYERDRYRDASPTSAVPPSTIALWFFAGYQYLRDYDSQPGADPAYPRTYEQDKFLGKLTWRIAQAGSWCRAFIRSCW